MRIERVLFVMVFIVGSFCVCAQTDERTMTREQRIAAHQARIKDIIRANRVVQMNRIPMSSWPKGIGEVNDPKTFESTHVPMLKQEIATGPQIDKLREVNAKLWELRLYDHEATKPEVSAKVKALLEEQEKVLSPDQSAAYAAAYQKYMEEMKKRTNAPQQPNQSNPDQ